MPDEREGMAGRDRVTLGEALESLSSEDNFVRFWAARWFPALTITPLVELVLVLWGDQKADYIEEKLRREYNVRLRGEAAAQIAEPELEPVQPPESIPEPEVVEVQATPTPITIPDVPEVLPVGSVLTSEELRELMEQMDLTPSMAQEQPTAEDLTVAKEPTDEEDG